MDTQTLYVPVQGNTRAKKGEWVGKGVGVCGLSDGGAGRVIEMPVKASGQIQ